MPAPDEALPGRAEPLERPDRHFVNGAPIAPPWPEGTRTAIFGLGCFWGAERVFWEAHDPTQGMRQGNDAGTQYRSIVIVTDEAEHRAVEMSRDAYAERLLAAGYGAITTEITDGGQFFYAEDHHQQYLARNPAGYCPDHGTGIACPIGLVVPAGDG